MTDEVAALVLRNNHLQTAALGGDLDAVARRFRDGIAAYRAWLGTHGAGSTAAADVAELEAAGVPDGLARRIAGLSAERHALDVILVAETAERPIGTAAAATADVATAFRFDAIDRIAHGLSPRDYFDGLALDRARRTLAEAQRSISIAVTRDGNGGVEGWLEPRRADVDRTLGTIGGLLQGEPASPAGSCSTGPAALLHARHHLHLRALLRRLDRVDPAGARRCGAMRRASPAWSSRSPRRARLDRRRAGRAQAVDRGVRRDDDAGICGMLWFVVPGAPAAVPLALVGFAIATIGAEYATVFNNAMMPSLVPARASAGCPAPAGRWAISAGLVSLALTLASWRPIPSPGGPSPGSSRLRPRPGAHEGDRMSGPLRRCGSRCS
jgi:hypothetical protein